MPVKGKWREVRAALEARRLSLDGEIAAYPAPIPACDAQYNHLIEERARLARELARLDAASAGGTDAEALKSFIGSSPFLADEEGEKQT